MDPERQAEWQAADTLFGQWLELSEPEREEWLASLAVEEGVRRRLEQMLAAHHNPRVSLDRDGGNLTGCRLGGWTLESELGRGGMAVVYRAWREQGMARQQAAIKILTLGALGATGRDRFQREAGILARLNHSNITALVDSGVADDGTCWLAMPLVEGERISDWCETQSLDAHATVRLYLQVCDAVAYAHRNLVVHRDLKPSNVLVDAGGHVRLLDFGIGQFTDSDDERTQTMWRAMTPGYAAPEQLRGAPPSTAIDVYGLGALLHRLLTGRTPQTATGGNESTRPSLLVRAVDDAYHRHYVPLKNDLDRVLLKALAEAPEQRYPSAEALASDLRRWLDGQPVLAQKPRLAYRMRKFVTRNKLAVAAAGLLVVTLGAGIGATAWQARIAQREATNARVEAQRAIQVRDFLERVFSSAEPTGEGVPSALDLLEDGARRARTEVLAEDPIAAADILLLTGYSRMHLSRFDEAQADLEEAQRLLLAHKPDALAELWRTHLHLGTIHRIKGDVDTALAHLRQAQAFNDRRSAPLDERVITDLNVGGVVIGRDPHAAKAIFREILASIRGSELEDTHRHLDALQSLGAALSMTRDADGEFAALVEEQVHLTRELYGEHSGKYARAVSDASLALRSVAGQFRRAREMALQGAALAERIYPQPHNHKTATSCNLGYVLMHGGELGDALVRFNAGHDNAAAIGQEDFGLVSCLRGRAYVLAALGRLDGARDDLDATRALLVRHDHLQSSLGLDICGMQASLHLRQGRTDRASEVLAACPPLELPASRDRMQGVAELHFARGELAEASRQLDEMRTQFKPNASSRMWMRPWMLSILLAEQSGDEILRGKLFASLAPHASASPLSQCLAAPGEATCLALP